MKNIWLSLGLTVVVAGCCKQDPGSAGSAPAASVGHLASATTTAPAATVAAAPGKLMGSCMIMGVACSDYYGAGSADVVKRVCQSVGKWTDGACPMAGIQGTCTKTEPGGIVNKAHTYPPGTPATAKKACDNTPGGVYSGS